MSANPFEVVINAAIEQSASVARAALLVSQTSGVEQAKPLSDYANEILDAVALVRP